MAKKQKKQASAGNSIPGPGAAPSAFADFAEDLGKLLGRTERKASEWLSQRKVLASQLSAVRDQADRLLRQLSGGASDLATAAAGLARGRRRTRVARSGSRPGRKTPMSAAEKKAVSERMKKYWAARRAKTGKKVVPRS
jgi:hypothetical protein